MPGFEALPDERRQVLELVLQGRKSYEEAADELDVAPSRVRSSARASLAELAPRTARAVDPAWRDQVADYLLGQQTGPEAKATRGHLKASEAARAWALSIMDSLDDLFMNGSEPEIPAPGASEAPPLFGRRPRADREARARPEREPRARPERPRRREAAPSTAEPLAEEVRSTVLRRRLAAALAFTLGAGLLAYLIGGGGDSAPPTAQSSAVSGQVGELAAERGEEGAGLVTVLRQGDQAGLQVQAKLEPPSDPKKEYYELWLYNDQDDAVSLTGGQPLPGDKEGNYGGLGGLPPDYESYEFIEISRESADDDAGHGGDSVLRTPIAELQDVPEEVLQQLEQGGGAAPAPGAQAPGAQAPGGGVPQVPEAPPVPTAPSGQPPAAP